jgi:AraC-like DNA-binding protein
MAGMIVDHDLFVRLARSRDFLAARSQQEVLLADAASMACLSKFHYLRMFRETFQETPRQFLQRRRMEMARHLLASTDRSIIDICLDVGYQSVGSFTTLFHESTGCTPSEYRRRTRPKQFAIRWAPQPPFIPSCFMAHYGILLP